MRIGIAIVIGAGAGVATGAGVDAGAGTDAGVDVIGSVVCFSDWQPVNKVQPKTAAPTRTGIFGIMQKECQKNAGWQLRMFVARAKMNSPASWAFTPPILRPARFLH
jgi:hypothetical protein